MNKYSDKQIYRIRDVKMPACSIDWEVVKLANQRKAPTAYDALACLTKYDIGTIDDFASEFGYTEQKPSKIIKTYMAVCEEWSNVQRLFGDVLEELQEIC